MQSLGDNFTNDAADRLQKAVAEVYQPILKKMQALRMGGGEADNRKNRRKRK